MAKGKKKKQKRRPPSPRRVARPTGGGALPVLMAPPNHDAARVFTFCHERAPGSLEVVECYFSIPEGLFRLRSQKTTRGQYVPWAQQMTRKPQPEMLGVPQRVVVSPAMLARKRWEIGRFVMRGLLGAEVDEALAARVADRRGVVPPHPALDLDLGDAPRVDVDRLGRDRPHRFRSFFHHGPIVMLRDQWHEFGAGTGGLIGGGGKSLLEGAVSEWARQWGHDQVTELLLDATTFYEAAGDLDAARCFRAVAAAPKAERPAAIDAFLLAWATYHFTEVETRV